ncbi:hypothetical protein OK016_19620 [Vibrio chagasii]|nr:hypothetical protein [Vibrio chagasii]
MISVLRDSPAIWSENGDAPKRCCVTLQYGGIEGQGFSYGHYPSMPEDLGSPSYKSNVALLIPKLR